MYLEILPEFETDSGRNNISLIKKILYGLKQSPRVWFGRFTKAITSLEYKQIQGDSYCIHKALRYK